MNPFDKNWGLVSKLIGARQKAGSWGLDHLNVPQFSSLSS